MANQEALRKWYTALKSGDYQQGPTFLRSVDDEYCCWGVACELAGLAARRWDPESQAYYYRNSSCLPPTEIDDWLGIDSMDEVSAPREVLEQFTNPLPPIINLAALNDLGVPFSVIADIIWDNYGEGDPPDA